MDVDVKVTMCVVVLRRVGVVVVVVVGGGRVGLFGREEGDDNDRVQCRGSECGVRGDGGGAVA